MAAVDGSLNIPAAPSQKFPGAAVFAEMAKALKIHLIPQKSLQETMDDLAERFHRPDLF